MRVAPAPPALIPKGLASEGLLAFIATAKFCDALPLYRQERQFARLGVELSRRTMSDSMIAVAAACEPLLELLLGRLRSEPKLQIDETNGRPERRRQIPRRHSGSRTGVARIQRPGLDWNRGEPSSVAQLNQGIYNEPDE